MPSASWHCRMARLLPTPPILPRRCRSSMPAQPPIRNRRFLRQIESFFTSLPAAADNKDMPRSALRLLIVCACLSVLGCAPWLIMPEQRELDLGAAHGLPPTPMREVAPPPTVADPSTAGERFLTLDEAIRIGLSNSSVVRVLAGVTAVPSGRTIYDPTIVNTVIDQERARFDHKLDVKNTFDRTDHPFGELDPLDPRGARIAELRTDEYHLDTGLSKTMPLGGTARLGFTDDRQRFAPGVFPLNPQNQHALTLSLTQP